MSVLLKHCGIFLSGHFEAAVYLHLERLVILDKFGKSCRIWAQATYKVVYVLCLSVPVDMTELSCKLRSRAEDLRTLNEASLYAHLHIALYDRLHGLNDQL